LAADAQGGVLSVMETDSGTVICLALPTQIGTQEHENPADTCGESGTFEQSHGSGTVTVPHTILVVDDEQSLRELLMHALSDRGYIVLESSCAEGAIMLMKTLQPSLLLSDINLRDATGIQLIRQARQLFPQLPALLMSEINQQTPAHDGPANDDTYLFHKPFAMADLHAKLEELLPPRRLAASAR
jgi:CheY-like chemotaxis protein